MSRAQLTSTVEQNTGGAVAPWVGAKNFAANGGFDWWQRGTSFSSSGVYSADRWYFTYGGTVTASQETSIIPTGATYAAKLLTGASSSFGELYNALESLEVNRLAGQTITVSGYVRAGSGYTGSAVIAIQTNTTANTQTGGTWTEQTYAIQTPSTFAYTRFSVTYAVLAGTAGLRIRLGNTSTQSSGVALYWGNIQIEIGSVATPFSRAGGTLQGELALCQRYYQRWVAGASGTDFLAGAFDSATIGIFMGTLGPSMRVAPSVSGANLICYQAGNGGKTFGAVTSRCSPNAISIVVTTAGASAGASGRVEDAGYATGYLEMNSEL